MPPPPPPLSFLVGGGAEDGGGGKGSNLQSVDDFGVEPSDRAVIVVVVVLWLNVSATCNMYGNLVSTLVIRSTDRDSVSETDPGRQFDV